MQENYAKILKALVSVQVKSTILTFKENDDLNYYDCKLLYHWGSSNISNLFLFKWHSLTTVTFVLSIHSCFKYGNMVTNQYFNTFS